MGVSILLDFVLHFPFPEADKWIILFLHAPFFLPSVLWGHGKHSLEEISQESSVILLLCDFIT